MFFSPAKSFALYMHFRNVCLIYDYCHCVLLFTVWCLFIFGLHRDNWIKKKNKHRSLWFLYNHFNNRNNSLYFHFGRNHVIFAIKFKHVYIFSLNETCVTRSTTHFGHRNCIAWEEKKKILLFENVCN